MGSPLPILRTSSTRIFLHDLFVPKLTSHHSESGQMYCRELSPFPIEPLSCGMFYPLKFVEQTLSLSSSLGSNLTYIANPLVEGHGLVLKWIIEFLVV